MNTVPIKQKCITNSPGANGYTTITSANIEIDATLCRVHTCHLQPYRVKAHHMFGLHVIAPFKTSCRKMKNEN